MPNRISLSCSRLLLCILAPMRTPLLESMAHRSARSLPRPPRLQLQETGKVCGRCCETYRQSLLIHRMAAGYRTQMEDVEISGLSFEERLAMLVDQHWTWRENQAMARRMKKFKLDAEPRVEDLDCRHPRRLDRR